MCYLCQLEQRYMSSPFDPAENPQTFYTSEMAALFWESNRNFTELKQWCLIVYLSLFPWGWVSWDFYFYYYFCVCKISFVPSLNKYQTSILALWPDNGLQQSKWAPCISGMHSRHSGCWDLQCTWKRIILIFIIFYN